MSQSTGIIDKIKAVTKNPLQWFLVKVLFFYSFWWVFQYNDLDEHSPVNDWITKVISQQSATGLSALGWDAKSVQHTYQGGRYGYTLANIITIDHRPLVWIESGCNGLVLMAFFTIFVLAYPGKWSKKLWYIPMGLLLIHIVNLFRVSLLAVNKYNGDANFDFNHKYVYSTVVYLVIFGLWMVWANKLSGIKIDEMGKSAEATS